MLSAGATVSPHLIPIAPGPTSSVVSRTPLLPSWKRAFNLGGRSYGRQNGAQSCDRFSSDLVR